MKKKNVFISLLLLVLCIGFIKTNTVQASAADTYWIKVNKQANVATVYKKQGADWVPIKAMLTSCGGSRTPSGTYYTKAKYRWATLMGPSYGQYSTRVVGGILFHSVWYYSTSLTAQTVREFNKLGSTASHGCIRMSTADCKWVYTNCGLKTKVTIYSSSDPGPLGKPAAYKMPSSAGSRNWDPTDDNPKNKYNQGLPILEPAVEKIPYGSTKYKTAKQLVSATQKNGGAVKSLTITSLKKLNPSDMRCYNASYSNTEPGRYKITYKLTGSTGVSITKTFVFTVLAKKK